MSIQILSVNLSTKLEEDYHLSSTLKDYVYRGLSAGDINNFDEAVSSVIKTYPISGEIIMTAYVRNDEFNDKLSTQLLSGYNISGAISSLAYLSSIDSSLITDISNYATKEDIPSLSAYLLSSDFDKLLSTAFTSSDFKYDRDNKALIINVKGQTLSVDIYDIFRDNIVKKMKLDEVDDKKYVFIEFNDVASSVISIDSEGFANSYEGYNGIAINGLSIMLSDDYFQKMQTVELSANKSEHIWLEDRVSSTISGYSDLSIIKLPLSDYAESAVGGTLSGNTLYVIDSDYIDAFGQQLCNLAMGDDYQYLGLGATDVYVDEVVSSAVSSVRDDMRLDASEVSSITTKSIDDITLGEAMVIFKTLCNKLSAI